MKIAIKVNPTRGKEIIKILFDLGGKSSFYNGNGTIKHYCYFIDEKNHNRIEYDIPPTNYKIYTLEEFEKEFPFKIGDKVQTTPYGEPAEVIKMYLNPACGIAYKVRYKSGVELQHCPENLKFYKEMQKERNITLTLDKAKEWYKKGGELKEIALQAFNENELNPLPRSWEEYCKYGNPVASWRYNIPTKYDALFKLERLRDCWRQGWVPDYTKTYKKYRIKKLGTEYIVDWSTGLSDFLVFQSEGLAKEFLECFRDLIEKAGDLI